MALGINRRYGAIQHMLRASCHQDGGCEQNPAVYTVLNTDNASHSEMVSVPPLLQGCLVF